MLPPESSAAMLNVIMLNVIMLNVIMLNVIMPNVIMLNVVAPPSFSSTFFCECLSLALEAFSKVSASFPSFFYPTKMKKIFSSGVWANVVKLFTAVM
jgi:hypothetical protein